MRRPGVEQRGGQEVGLEGQDGQGEHGEEGQHLIRKYFKLQLYNISACIIIKLKDDMIE